MFLNVNIYKIYNKALCLYLFMYLKKIAGVVPGPRQSHPSALPLKTRVIFIKRYILVRKTNKYFPRSRLFVGNPV